MDFATMRKPFFFKFAPKNIAWPCLGILRLSKVWQHLAFEWSFIGTNNNNWYYHNKKTTYFSIWLWNYKMYQLKIYFLVTKGKSLFSSLKGFENLRIRMFFITHIYFPISIHLYIPRSRKAIDYCWRKSKYVIIWLYFFECPRRTCPVQTCSIRTPAK